MTLLTIFIPTYNRPEYLAQCLANLAEQTFKDFSIVVLDDCSDSDYAAALKPDYGTSISYVRHEHQLGNGRNTLYGMTIPPRSKYIMIMHDDDLLHPHLLELEIAALESTCSLAFATTEALEFRGRPPATSSPGQLHPSSGSLQVLSDPAQLARALLKGARLPFGATLYRWNVVHRLTFDPVPFGTFFDRPYLLEVAGKGSAGVIPGPFYFYRHHEAQDSKSSTVHEDHLLELFKAYRRALESQWSWKEAWLLYRAVGEAAIDSHRRLPSRNRNPLLKFLARCKRAGVLRYPFLVFFLLPRIKNLPRKLKSMVFREPKPTDTEERSTEPPRHS